MLGMMAGQVMLQAAVLSVILYYVARHEADYSIPKVAMVVAGITLGTFLIDTFVGPHIGLFTVVVDIAFICFMLMTFCWITLRKSIVVVSIFSCFYLAMFLVMATIKARISASMGTPLMERRNQDLDEIKQEILRQQQGFAGTPRHDPDDMPGALSTKAMIETHLDRTVQSEASVETTATAVVVETAVPLPTQQVQIVETAAPLIAVTMTNAPPAVAEDPGWREARRKLKLGGAVRGKNGEWTAFVNNKLVEVGDVVSSRHEKLIYFWKVRTIGKDGLTFDPKETRPEK